MSGVSANQPSNLEDMPYQSCEVVDLRTGGVLGLFQAAGRIQQSGWLPPGQTRRLSEVIDWIRARLPRPDLVLDHPVYRDGEGGERVWCKLATGELIHHIRDIAGIVLEDFNNRGGSFVPCGAFTDGPLGTVSYEDEFLAVEVESDAEAAP
jgi:hypothetical protein